MIAAALVRPLLRPLVGSGRRLQGSTAAPQQIPDAQQGASLLLGFAQGLYAEQDATEVLINQRSPAPSLLLDFAQGHYATQHGLELNANALQLRPALLLDFLANHHFTEA